MPESANGWHNRRRRSCAFPERGRFTGTMAAAAVSTASGATDDTHASDVIRSSSIGAPSADGCRRESGPSVTTTSQLSSLRFSHWHSMTDRWRFCPALRSRRSTQIHPIASPAEGHRCTPRSVVSAACTEDTINAVARLGQRPRSCPLLRRLFDPAHVQLLQLDGIVRGGCPLA